MILKSRTLVRRCFTEKTFRRLKEKLQESTCEWVLVVFFWIINFYIRSSVDRKPLLSFVLSTLIIFSNAHKNWIKFWEWLMGKSKVICLSKEKKQLLPSCHLGLSLQYHKFEANYSVEVNDFDIFSWGSQF